MIPVRQSTAFETAIGPVLDADGVAVTDCVVADFKIKKTTGDFAALNGSATLTHVSAGVYDLVLTTSDLGTVGVNVIAIDDTVNGCAPLYLQVMEEDVYDSLYASAAVALATATELAKVPKSDGTVGWNATARGHIQAEAEDALVARGITPALIYTLSGLKIFGGDDITVGDTGNTTTTLHLPDFAGFADDTLNDLMLIFADASDTNKKHVRWITDWVQSTAIATIDVAVPTPEDFADTVMVYAFRRDTRIANVAQSSTALSNVQWTNARAGYLDNVSDTYALANGASGFVATKAAVDAKASQTSVDDLPTNAELATALGTADDAVLTAIGDLPTNAELATALGTADDAVLAAIAALNDLSNAQLTTAIAAGDDATLAAIAAVQADLPSRLTKNTAFTNFPFKMVDSSDHSTAEIGLTVTATRSLDGAAFAACANAVGEIANGWYKVDLAAGDLNGNSVVLRFTASGADAAEFTIITQVT